MDATHPAGLISMGLLVLAMISTRVTRFYWLLPASLSLVFGYVAQLLSVLAVVSAALYFLLVFLFARAITPWRTPLLLLCLLGALLFGFHVIPGFTPLTVFEQQWFGEGAVPITLRLNYDKAMVGLVLLGCLAPASCFTLAGIKRAVPAIAGGVILLSVLGLMLGLMPDPKFNLLIAYFLAANLFFTCVAEESFFRLLIQSELNRILMKRKYAQWWVIGVVCMLFTAVHAAPGVRVEWLLLVAAGGLFYAAVYQYFKSIDAAIIAHFLANATHILLLTYPFPKT